MHVTLPLNKVVSQLSVNIFILLSNLHGHCHTYIRKVSSKSLNER